MCCVALRCYLFDLACFFLPPFSHLSLKHAHVNLYRKMCYKLHLMSKRALGNFMSVRVTYLYLCIVCVPNSYTYSCTDTHTHTHSGRVLCRVAICSHYRAVQLELRVPRPHRECCGSGGHLCLPVAAHDQRTQSSRTRED